MFPSHDRGEQIARGISAQFGNPISQMRTITFSATKDSTRYANARLALDIRVNITHHVYGHDGAYVVVGHKHSYTAGEEGTWDVTWILKPIDRLLFWYLGEPGRSELGTTTTLAY